MRKLESNEAISFIGKKIYLDKEGVTEASLQGVIHDADIGVVLIVKTSSHTTEATSVYIKEKRPLTQEELRAFAVINANKMQVIIANNWIPVSSVQYAGVSGSYWFRTVKIKDGKFIYGKPFQPTVEE